jgi:malate/lactate dehydrogenase
LSLLGVPPAHTVIAWGDATIGGFALTRVVDEPARRRLAARIDALWPTGPYALAAAAVAVVEAMSGRSRRLRSVFIAPDLSSGMNTRTGAMPVRLGATGIEDLVLPSLSAVEQVALDNAMML